MIDDTRQPSSQQYDSSFTAQLEAISECTITRGNCYSWAQNLKYLAYYHDTHDLFQSTCRQLEVTQEDDLTVFVESKENVWSFSLDDEAACKLCRSCPKFPPHEKAKTFQLVQFGERGESTGYRPCRDYLAVSYCWPKDSQGKPIPYQSTYTLTTTDDNGTRITKPVGAPDEVIDRAVECARNLNIRLIWLDQACLPQDESEEHATGIQAMDMVYQQARISVGLIDRVKITQAQLTAIAVVMCGQTDAGVPGEKQNTIQPASRSLDWVATPLMEFLDAFADDPFNSRAWILQEMISAGKRAVLLFKQEEGASYQESFHALRLQQFGILETFNILLWDMPKLISKAKDYLESIQNSVPHQPPSTRVKEVMAKLQRFHPQLFESSHWSSFVYMRGGSSYGPRKTCNAAVALTYLSTRDNFNVTDRLAILANICGYEIRLDIFKIEKLCQSLATCIFALAFLNGDLSLFMPEVYSSSFDPNHVCTSLGLQGDHNNCLNSNSSVKWPSWMIPFHQIVPSICTNVSRESPTISLRNGNLYQVKNSRIMLPGSLWKVDRQIELQSIQRHFKSAWASLERSQVRSRAAFCRTKTGSAPHIQECMPSTQQTSNTTIEPRSNNSKIEHHNEQMVTHVVSGYHIDSDREAQIKVGLLMCHILAHLHYHLGETAVANSIWHCVRSDSAPIQLSQRSDKEKPESTDLPDEVEGVLAACGSMADLWKAFKFDLDHNGSFRQFWIIERIMRDGYLWAGNQEIQRKFFGGYFGKQTRTDTESEKMFQSNVLQRQMSRQVLANLMLVQRGFNPKNLGNASINLGAVVDCVTEINWNNQRRYRGVNRGTGVSVFDVEGPCEVFVPLDRDLETLPREHHRSMSLCWIVERVDNPKNEHLKIIRLNEFKELKAYLAGVMRFDEDRRTSTQAQRHESHATLSKTLEEGSKQSPEPSNHSTSHDNLDNDSINDVTKAWARILRYEVCATLRVVDRVKGAWECIDNPRQGYAFV